MSSKAATGNHKCEDTQTFHSFERQISGKEGRITTERIRGDIYAWASLRVFSQTVDQITLVYDATTAKTIRKHSTPVHITLSAPSRPASTRTSEPSSFSIRNSFSEPHGKPFLGTSEKPFFKSGLYRGKFHTFHGVSFKGHVLGCCWHFGNRNYSASLRRWR